MPRLELGHSRLGPVLELVESDDQGDFVLSSIPLSDIFRAWDEWKGKAKHGLRKTPHMKGDAT